MRNTLNSSLQALEKQIKDTVTAQIAREITNAISKDQDNKSQQMLDWMSAERKSREDDIKLISNGLDEVKKAFALQDQAQTDQVCKCITANSKTADQVRELQARILLVSEKGQADMNAWE